MRKCASANVRKCVGAQVREYLGAGAPTCPGPHLRTGALEHSPTCAPAHPRTFALAAVHTDLSLILSIVRDRGVAEEILQEAFVRVWTRAEIYDARTGGPMPWIVRVARDGAIDRLGSRRVRATVDALAIDLAAFESAAPATGIRTPEAAVLDAERRRTLTDALAGLPA